MKNWDFFYLCMLPSFSSYSILPPSFFAIIFTTASCNGPKERSYLTSEAFPQQVRRVKEWHRIPWILGCCNLSSSFLVFFFFRLLLSSFSSVLLTRFGESEEQKCESLKENLRITIWCKCSRQCAALQAHANTHEK